MNRFFLFLYIVLSSIAAARAQQKSPVAVLTKSKADGMWIRWAPTTPTYWQLGNKYGYILERFSILPNGDLEENSQLTLTQAPLKPYDRAAFLPLAEKSDEVATLEELLYGESAAASYSGNDISSILSKNNELQNRFGIALLMCDLSLEAAQAGGLFYKDTQAVKGKRYIYRLKLAYSSPSLPLEPVVSVVSFTDETPLTVIKDLSAEFGDKTVTLSWPTLLHKGVYTAYYLERSTDGKTFTRLTDLPYVHMTEKLESETAFYVDSLESNQKKYFYRVQGISPFAEKGPYSAVISGEGRESLFGQLILREAKVLANRQVKLTWEFPQMFEKQVNGFKVSRANNPNGPFTDVAGKPLAKEIREYMDVTSFNNTFYIIKAIDKNGREITRSFPYLAQIEDNTPPAVPVEITGSIEKSGVTRLTWKANGDADLRGYRVFRSNDLREEPIEVTTSIITTPAFADTINTNVLDRKVYYHVVAVDKNYNISGYSKSYAMARPDILAPAAPVFTKVEMIKDSILLEWSNSVSEDVARYELTRIEKENSLNRTVRTWYPSALVEKYQDRGLVPGHTYSYRIAAYDSAGNKSEGASREIIYEPGFRPSVTNVRATVDREKKTITLQWKNREPSVKCLIYKKVNTNAFTLYQTLEGNVEFFEDRAISINTSCSYKIQPVFGKGVKGVISEEVKVIY